jgi:hypothetical protein
LCLAGQGLRQEAHSLRNCPEHPVEGRF